MGLGVQVVGQSNEMSHISTPHGAVTDLDETQQLLEDNPPCQIVFRPDDVGGLGEMANTQFATVRFLAFVCF